MTPRTRLSATVLSGPDPRGLAAFYERLLGWEKTSEDDTWVMLRSPSGGAGLSFQYEEVYTRPVWPSTPGAPEMMAHLDIAVEDVDAAVEWAASAGATLAEFQPQAHVRVMLDPAGHPFCLFPDEA